ncbi:hypothetical protein PFLG_01778 [Plasmodium falciparum RAJ116]|uniref:Dynein heavy chain linker domain-containing protein n=1 Tax=Plasmodium falciparum RAJ116 TaxID=580058 RepID=A0A0L0CW17_PLAFA|nr:hypothetical protein PFLG_01778 [Plasmodium falciparum RAJ116]
MNYSSLKKNLVINFENFMNPYDFNEKKKRKEKSICELNTQKKKKKNADDLIEDVVKKEDMLYYTKRKKSGMEKKELNILLEIDDILKENVNDKEKIITNNMKIINDEKKKIDEKGKLYGNKNVASQNKEIHIKEKIKKKYNNNNNNNNNIIKNEEYEENNMDEKKKNMDIIEVSFSVINKWRNHNELIDFVKNNLKNNEFIYVKSLPNFSYEIASWENKKKMDVLSISLNGVMINEKNETSFYELNEWKSHMNLLRSALDLRFIRKYKLYKYFFFLKNMIKSTKFKNKKFYIKENLLFLNEAFFNGFIKIEKVLKHIGKTKLIDININNMTIDQYVELQDEYMMKFDSFLNNKIKYIINIIYIYCMTALNNFLIKNDITIKRKQIENEEYIDIFMNDHMNSIETFDEQIRVNTSIDLHTKEENHNVNNKIKTEKKTNTKIKTNTNTKIKTDTNTKIKTNTNTKTQKETNRNTKNTDKKQFPKKKNNQNKNDTEINIYYNKIALSNCYSIYLKKFIQVCQYMCDNILRNIIINTYTYFLDLLNNYFETNLEHTKDVNDLQYPNHNVHIFMDKEKYYGKKKEYNKDDDNNKKYPNLSYHKNKHVTKNQTHGTLPYESIKQKKNSDKEKQKQRKKFLFSSITNRKEDNNTEEKIKNYKARYIVKRAEKNSRVDDKVANGMIIKMNEINNEINNDNNNDNDNNDNNNNNTNTTTNNNSNNNNNNNNNNEVENEKVPKNDVCLFNISISIKNNHLHIYPESELLINTMTKYINKSIENVCKREEFIKSYKIKEFFRNEIFIDNIIFHKHNINNNINNNNINEYKDNHADGCIDNPVDGYSYHNNNVHVDNKKFEEFINNDEVIHNLDIELKEKIKLLYDDMVDVCQEFYEIIDTYNKYDELNIEEIDIMDVEFITNLFLSLKDLENKIKRMSKQLNIHIFKVDNTILIEYILKNINKKWTLLINYLPTLNNKTIETLTIKLDTSLNIINKTPTNINELVSYIDFVNTFSINLVSIEEEIESIFSLFLLFKKYYISICGNQTTKIFHMNQKMNFIKSILNSEVNYDIQYSYIFKDLNSQINNVEKNIQNFLNIMNTNFLDQQNNYEWDDIIKDLNFVYPINHINEVFL